MDFSKFLGLFISAGERPAVPSSHTGGASLLLCLLALLLGYSPGPDPRRRGVEREKKCTGLLKKLHLTTHRYKEACILTLECQAGTKQDVLKTYSVKWGNAHEIIISE